MRVKQGRDTKCVGEICLITNVKRDSRRGERGAGRRKELVRGARGDICRPSSSASEIAEICTRCCVMASSGTLGLALAKDASLATDRSLCKRGKEISRDLGTLGARRLHAATMVLRD